MRKKGKVLLIGSEEEENLAIRYLGAVLEENRHKVRICPCSKKSDFKKIINNMKRFRPDLIGVSLAFQQLATMYFVLINRLRKAGYKKHVVVGGHFATFEYKEILRTQKGIDTVIRFEGEKPIIELINALKSNSKVDKVHNLVYRKKGKIIENKCIFKFQELGTLPHPIRTKKSQQRIGEKFATLISSRGCWHSSCLYCCIGAFHSKKKGEKYTFRSPESVAKEIAQLYHKKGVRLFQFHDDNFMMPSKKDTVKRFQRLRKELVNNNIDLNKIAFVIKARPDSIDNDIAKELAKLGVIGTFLGVENASKSGLKALVRGNSIESVNKAIKSLKKHSIIVTYNLLIFHPTAEMNEISDNIKFIKKYPYLPFDVARAEIVAGSPLERLVIHKKTRIGSWPNWGYILDDSIVDAMFEIYLKSFRRKGSLCQTLAQNSIMLGYHSYIMKRLHKGKISFNLARLATDKVREAGMFIADQLELMKQLALDKASEKDIKEYDKKLYAGCSRLNTEMERIINRMKKVQFIEQEFEKFGIKHIVQENRLIADIFQI